MLVLDENRRIGTDAEPLSELSRLIRRDRNHPSVFMWSLANEEYYLQGTSTGAAIIQVMQNLVHSLDSTRRCTAAQNSSFGSGMSLVLDVNGFNYHLDQLDSYHTNYPTEPIIGTETSALVSDRGVYSNDAVNGYVWGYDIENSGIGGGGTSAEAWWSYYDARPWASGGFSWTGFDYRGEPNPYGWPCINSHFGTLDTCGFPKDNFYYYQANWTFKPVLHLFPHWNWSTPGQPINIWVFGNCQEVELFTNGVSLGRQSLNVQGHVEWDNVPYAAGTLKAVGYNFGVPVLTNTVTTTGAPAAIALRPDRSTILADGRDVSVVTVAVLDAQGNVVPTASNEIYFSINGGTILGVGNGNPSSHEADKASQRATFSGLAQVIVQSTVQPGIITLTATSPGLNSTALVLTAASSLPPPAAPTGVTAVAGNAQVTISWDIVPGATNYNLWRATTHGGPYTLVAGNIGGVNLGYTDNTATNPITYYYVVTANGNGTSLNSAEVSAAPLTLPAAPSGLAATALSETQVQLTWTDNAPNAGYIVARSLDSNSWSVLTGSPLANSSSYTDATCSASTLYYYRVNCTNQVGASGYATASVTTPAGVGDGIPGWWRLKYFGDGLTTNSSSCVTCDPDGDGQNNLMEFLAGLDPTNTSSYWLVQGTPTNGQLPLTVSFTENSTASTITNRLWDFGDGSTGSGTNPSHTYTNAGTFSVGLTILNLDGAATLVASNLITVSPARGFWPTVVGIGPVAYWRLDETNGATVAIDYLGFNNGTISTSVTPGASGPQSPAFPGFETNNTAIQFNYTSGSYLTMPSLNLNTNTVTITGWINPTGIQAGWTGIAFCRGGSTCAGLNFGPGSIANELRYTWNNSRWDKTTGLAAPAGQWSFVALVVTPTNGTIYLGANGVLNSFVDTTSEPSQTFDSSLLIGYDPSSGSRLFNGVIDEVAIFNRSLMPAQIQQLYTSALTPPPPPLTPFQTWQLQYFGCTNCPQSAPDADPLGKGMSNTNQFLAGLNPTNPGSVFRITSVVTDSSNNVVITWSTAGIRTNAVQAASGDANSSYSANFADITASPHVIISGSGDATTNYTDFGGATNSHPRYYRIRLVP
jgi:PKD repeat protein